MYFNAPPVPLPTRCISHRPGTNTSRRSRYTGFGSAGVLEIIKDWQTSTYRAVYTVRFETAVFVLHVFQKKSKRGAATPKQDIDLIRERLKTAERIVKELTK